MRRKYLRAGSQGNQTRKEEQEQELQSYRPEFAAQARKLCQLGVTDIELADFFSVTTQTLRTWRAGYKEFSYAMRIGQEEADQRVQRSFYQRACGYERDAIRIINSTIVRYREHVPGNVAAQLKWLAARRPDRWGKNPVASEDKRKKTFEESTYDLIQFLIECGVPIEHPDKQIDEDSTVALPFRIARSASSRHNRTSSAPCWNIGPGALRRARTA
jgi:hypothetical protein